MAKRNYFNNDEIQPAIIKYQETGDIRSLDKYTSSFQQLVKAIINTHKFYRFHSDRNELEQEGMVELIAALKRFDPTRGTAFNYLSIVVKNHIKNWTKSRNKKDWVTDEYNDVLYKSEKQAAFDEFALVDMFSDVEVPLHLEPLLERIVTIITKMKIFYKRDIIKFLVREGWPRPDIDTVYKCLEEKFEDFLDGEG